MFSFLVIGIFAMPNAPSSMHYAPCALPLSLCAMLFALCVFSIPNAKKQHPHRTLKRLGIARSD
jgi:branched-subunit amino acid transport protein AzlD